MVWRFSRHYVTGSLFGRIPWVENPRLPSVFATRTGARRRLGAEGIEFFDEGAELLGVGDADFELVVRQAAVEFFDGVEVGGIVDDDAQGFRVGELTERECLVFAGESGGDMAQNVRGDGNLFEVDELGPELGGFLGVIVGHRARSAEVGGLSSWV
jgi:hypothetical protein